MGEEDQVTQGGEEPQIVIEQTVGLIPRTDLALDHLEQMTGLGRNDLFNRAVQILEMLTEHMGEGYEVTLVHQDRPAKTVAWI